MNTGFTGTVHPLTEDQLRGLRKALRSVLGKGDTFRHGDCVGADEAAERIAHQIGARVVVHPGENERWQASFHRGRIEGHVYLPSKPNLERNRDIVNGSEVMVAVPHIKLHRQCRHGECATVRYALSQGKDVTVVHPDGSYEQYLPEEPVADAGV